MMGDIMIDDDFDMVVDGSDMATLRDQFAMAALTALGQAFTRDWHNPNEYQVKRMAEGAYLVADAMLAARGGEA